MKDLRMILVKVFIMASLLVLLSNVRPIVMKGWSTVDNNAAVVTLNGGTDAFCEQQANKATGKLIDVSFDVFGWIVAGLTGFSVSKNFVNMFKSKKQN